MSERSRSLVKVIQAGAGVDQAVGAAYRGVLLLGEASALARMSEASLEIARKVYYAKSHYLIFVQTESELARTTALALTRSLAGDAGKVLQGAELADAARTLTGWTRVLEEGADTALLLERAEGLASVAARRGQAALERLAARSSTERWIEVASGIDLAVGRTLIEPVSSPAKRALELFLRAVPRTEIAAWDVMAGKVTGFTLLQDKADALRAAGRLFDEDAFRAALRPEASALKGLALETWFWRSPAWLSRESRLTEGAFRRARALGSAGRSWEPIRITEPLLTMGGMGRRAGLEIYDGVVLIARDYRAGLGVVEGYLEVVVQIKAERRISAVQQVAKDLRRERELGGLTELRTRDGNLVVRLLPAPDNVDPFRLIVAPELPTGRLALLPPGVQVAALPTLMTAAQLDDFAYLLLRGALGGP